MVWDVSLIDDLFSRRTLTASISLIRSVIWFCWVSIVLLRFSTRLDSEEDVVDSSRDKEAEI